LLYLIIFFNRRVGVNTLPYRVTNNERHEVLVGNKADEDKDGRARVQASFNKASLLQKSEI
jgi:hypothetical protein